MPKLPVWVRVLVLPIGGCALATLITWKLWPFIQPSASPLFFLAVMISALYGGVVAGLIATLLSAATTAYLFMTPQFSMAIDHSDIFRLVVFAAVALLTSWIGFQRNRTDEQQQRLVAELRAANARIRTLSDMLPICPDCRRVRVGEDDSGVENRGDVPRGHAGAAVEPRALSRVFSAALSGVSRADRLSRATFSVSRSQLFDLQLWRGRNLRVRTLPDAVGQHHEDRHDTRTRNLTGPDGKPHQRSLSVQLSRVSGREGELAAKLPKVYHRRRDS